MPPPAPTQGAETASDGDPYSDVIGRRSVDYLLRNTHQQLVALSSQADVKASMMITVSAVLLSLTATYLDDRNLRWSTVTLMVFLLLALVFAILAVLPKFRLLRRRPAGRPIGYDPLFFGHFAEVQKETYVTEMADILQDDATVYRTLVTNLHNQGTYLVGAKYRLLKLSYLCFLSGFATAAVVLGVTLALH